MLTVAQTELLNEILGSNGFLFESIIENKSINMGSKLYYLKRSIQESCHSFLEHLDKLYKKNLSSDEQSQLLDIIRCFKKINDLCFNNEVKNGDYGVKPCLELTFGRLGAVDATEFKNIISDMVTKNIEELAKQNTDIVKAEYIQRKKIMKNQSPSKEWRSILELPASQMVEPEYSIFNPRRNQSQVPLEQRMQLAQQQLYLGDYGVSISLSEFLNLDDPNNQTASNEMLSRIALLVSIGHIPLQILMCNISGSLLMRYLNSVDDLISLITKAEISFNIFLSFDDQIQKQLLKYSDSVYTLIKECGLTIDQLVEQPNEKLNVLLSHPNSLQATLIIQDLITFKNFHP
jgi:hypothetical protein